MRYVGQEYTVNVAVADGCSLAEIDASFHEAHRIRYGHSTPGAPVEFVNLRIAAMGRIGTGGGARPPARPRMRTRCSAGAASIFAGVEHETPVLLATGMRPGRDCPGRP